MKKRSITILLVCSLIWSLAACTGVGAAGGTQSSQTPQLPQADAVLSGTIVQIKDGSLLLAGTGADQLYDISTTLDLFDAEGTAVQEADLKAGQRVDVGYSGAILESWPSQLSAPVYLQITGQGNDLVGFYQGVLHDLWDVDPGLNPGIGVLAFDLSRLTNLTDGEKSALIYLVSGMYEMAGIAGTFDQLCDEGYIDKDHLRFEGGMLFSFELNDVTEDSFSFDVTKWRSGTGAYTFHDCSAVKGEDDWNYTVGSEMIS